MAIVRVFEHELDVPAVAARDGDLVVVVLSPGLPELSRRRLLKDLLSSDELAAYDEKWRSEA